MKEANEILLEEREELTLQNIRVISSGISDEGRAPRTPPRTDLCCLTVEP